MSEQKTLSKEYGSYKKSHFLICPFYLETVQGITRGEVS